MPIERILESKKDQLLDELIIWAVRYAITRNSYANNSVAEAACELINADILSAQTLAVLRGDILQALNDHTIPHEDQRDVWSAVAALAGERLEQKNNTIEERP